MSLPGTTPALKRAYVSAPAEDIIFDTLELHHSRFSQVWRLANFDEPVVKHDEQGADILFIPAPMQVLLPASDGQGRQDLKITMANIGRQMMDEVQRAAANPFETIRVVYRAYLYSSPEPQTLPMELTISEISFNAEVLTATATRADMLNRKFPGRVYEALWFPGLDR